MTNALVLLANGSEEIEAVIVVDVLRRAGWNVTMASIETDLHIVASRGVRITAGAQLVDLDTTTFDLAVLPGGRAGAEAFAAHRGVINLLRTFYGQQKCIAAICAAPLALGAAGILHQHRYTCYPGIETEIEDGVFCPDAAVVEDANIVTSQGPGTAFAFALALVARFDSPCAAQKLREQMLLA